MINLTLPLPVLSAVYNFRFGGCIQTSQEFYKPLLEAPTGSGAPGSQVPLGAGMTSVKLVPRLRGKFLPLGWPRAQRLLSGLGPQLAAAGPEQGRERDGKISPVSGPLFIDCPRFLPNLTFSTCPALSTVKENSTLLIDRK